jgi:hypothetical protein
MEVAKQRNNLHKISLRRKHPGEGNILETLQLKKVSFSYRPSERPSQKLSVQ